MSVAARVEATCHALKMVNAKGVAPASTTPPAGNLSPTQLQSADKLTGLASGGRTVASVDAYGYTNLEKDLGVNRSQFGLPPCTKANGCLTVLNQNGGTSLPRMDVGWAQEQAWTSTPSRRAAPTARPLSSRPRARRSATWAPRSTRREAAGRRGVVRHRMREASDGRRLRSLRPG